MSHLGRPKGIEERFSLKHIVDKVSEVIGVQIRFVDDCIGDHVKDAIENLKNGEVLLLENSFIAEEKREKSLLLKNYQNGEIFM